MLASKQRFHGRKAINNVYRYGQTVNSPVLGLRFLARREGLVSRSAVVVAKKVNKSAVKRNRIRRQLYEVIRLNNSKLLFPTDLIFSVYSDDLLSLDSKKLNTLIEDLISRVNSSRSKLPPN